MRLLGPLPKDVLEVVAELTGLDTAEILGPRRFRHLCTARFITCWVARRFGATYPELADFFHLDHTTVMYGVERVENDRPLLLAALAVVDVLNVRHAPAPETLPFLVPESRPGRPVLSQRTEE